YYETISYCNQANEFKPFCLRGLGAFIARNSNYAPEKVIERCGSNPGYENCISGAAAEYGLSLEISRGIEFCSKLGFQSLNCYLEFFHKLAKHI
ncbi:MAG: hypothetical protein Q7K42_06540, partial [Candidatus Diapherotrites archaeon]|nr:hypothetical protein [Candidatus Diapherotrites archaeon]